MPICLWSMYLQVQECQVILRLLFLWAMYLQVPECQCIMPLCLWSIYLQVHECQVIMPLSLATDNTCVVLAGDHLQMGQKVYSDEARELNFGLSVVERLFNYYEKKSTDDCVLPRILLKTNYRNHPEILRFLSSVFYNGPDVLIAKSEQQLVGKVLPLNFYVACGQETQDNNSTSWYNLAEIHEVVERVNELYQSWPESWGPKDTKAILVTTAYSDQVSSRSLCLSISVH